MKSYYMQMKPEVLKTVQYWTDDFTVHDEKTLTKRKPNHFLLCFRETGTHFIHLDKWDEMTRTEITDEYDLCRNVIDRNQRFYIGKDGTATLTSKEDVIYQLGKVSRTAKDRRFNCDYCNKENHRSTAVYHTPTNKEYCSDYCLVRTVAARDQTLVTI